ncbi:DoxX family protein [Deinococcus radiotolerans]|uniref:DoxX family protein n=1 Tax=Deinococcus radiotolerans TaxID=1309407 RepID=A0ABQ2FP82_9DEIO|nr:DoxX family protein [Deinococcus radiotolerans]GGL13346.1 hypothetical protein GCM10010844_35230 [Deinococcus radiotolerans]
MASSPVSYRPGVGALLLSALFVTAGTLHFVTPTFFDRIVPPWVPMTPRQATVISGAAELLGGLGLLHPGTRPAAHWGLIVLLVAVFPANLWMAQDPPRFHVSPLVAWGRLPLQPLLIWAVWRAGRRSPGSR